MKKKVCLCVCACAGLFQQLPSPFKYKKSRESKGCVALFLSRLGCSKWFACFRNIQENVVSIHNDIQHTSTCS